MATLATCVLTGRQMAGIPSASSGHPTHLCAPHSHVCSSPAAGPQHRRRAEQCAAARGRSLQHVRRATGAHAARASAGWAGLWRRIGAGAPLPGRDRPAGHPRRPGHARAGAQGGFIAPLPAQHTLCIWPSSLAPHCPPCTSCSTPRAPCLSPRLRQVFINVGILAAYLIGFPYEAGAASVQLLGHEVAWW